MIQILVVENLSKTIRNKKIINNVSFNLKKGEILGLIGPNGAGKTTLMRMIMGMVSIDNGSILVDGKSIKKHREDILRRIGGIIEVPKFYPYLTGFENLKYYSILSKNKNNLDIHEVMSLLGLENAKQQKVKNYSLGMKQRLGIAQAILHEPSVLILDEPMNGLDPIGVNVLRNYIKDVARKKNVAVILASHLISELEGICDTALILKEGVTHEKIQLSETACLNQIELVSITVNKNYIDKAIKKIICFFEDEKPTVIVEGNQLKLYLNVESVPLLLQKLLNDNIKVYEVKREKRTLEERFFNVIGGNTSEYTTWKFKGRNI
ncbi:ABC transporter ATP-binding protein [Bacillus subtilis]|uniref:ABC transporter ATP-binding protein n=1 Tax=Bacillus subtilis TaxID=1423 RepID=UPI001D07FF00|nr:ATP-binding cassette domain-containing protein [Bacillus subtilis]MCB7162031.1 ABC transporter ATP-binding protein [Bacillus subtilis]MCB7460281.1 ABC transporter ATP-binding protein [Bacillus subtilis]